jgi:hypothetical protein
VLNGISGAWLNGGGSIRDGSGRRVFRRLVSWLCCSLLATSFVARADDQEAKRFRFFGDFRFRLEQDWDSLQGDGTKRDDRLRARIRLRLGFDARISERWSAMVQLRTGPKLSQQSPHITIYDFDGGEDGPYQASFDHWFVRYATDKLDIWVGRNELSYVHQDDLFIFDNVTYAGAGGSYRQEVGRGTLIWNLNLVALPVGMRDFSGHGMFGQLAYDRDFESSGLTVAGGFMLTKADPDDPVGTLLLTGNNTRDYRILNLQFWFSGRLFHRPYRAGLDLSHNAANYDNAPPGSFSEFHRDRVNGWAVEIEWGSRDEAGDWLVGYYYAFQEALAAHSSYIQDDWVRWGNANQVRATNLKGSELRFIYTIRPNMNIFSRLFFVNAIDLLLPGDTTKETGNRFRVDYNFSF